MERRILTSNGKKLSTKSDHIATSVKICHRILPMNGMRVSMRWLPAILMLTACTTTMVWDKPNATQQEYNVDHYACMKDARQSGYSGLVSTINISSFFKECMVAHGWTLVPEGPKQPVADLGGAPDGPESGIPSGFRPYVAKLPQTRE